MNKGNWVNECVKNLQNKGFNKKESLNICHCLITNLSEGLTLDEFNDSFATALYFGKDSEGAAQMILKNQMLSKNQLIYSLVEDCVIKIANIGAGKFKVSNRNIEIMAQSHLIDLKKELGNSEYNSLLRFFNLKNYSECYIKKMINNFTIEEIININQENQKKLEKFQLDCFSANIRQ